MINWYLTEIVVQEQEVDNQDELLERKAIAEKVIDRLAYEDRDGGDSIGQRKLGIENCICFNFS